MHKTGAQPVDACLTPVMLWAVMVIFDDEETAKSLEITDTSVLSVLLSLWAQDRLQSSP